MILTESNIRRIYDSVPRIVLERRMFSYATGTETTVFLSHKHTDTTQLFAVKHILEKLGDVGKVPMLPCYYTNKNKKTESLY